MPRLTQQGAVSVIAPVGDINHHEMACVKNAISDLALASGRHVVLDLSTVDHINYMTLGVLAERAGRLRRLGGDLRLAGASEYLRQILRFTGVHHLFAVYDTVEAAVASFQESSPVALAASGSRGSWVPQMH